MNFQTYQFITFVLIVISVGLFFKFYEKSPEIPVSSKKTDSKDKYYWEPTASTPEKNASQMFDVSYFFENGSSLSVFGPEFLSSGMGIGSCGVDYGKDWKIELPTAIGAKWISFAEKKAYIVYEEIPIDELKTLFENGYESFDRQGNSIHGDYIRLNLCLLPEGEVVLYVNSGNRRILLDWSAKGEQSQDFDLFRKEGYYSKTLDEYISNMINKYPEFNVPHPASLDLIHKYFERFNYNIKVDFEDESSSMWWFSYEYSNSELSIAYSRDNETSIKYPSRMKNFVVSWKVSGFKYTAYFYFNEEEVLRVFDEAYGMDKKQNGELKIYVSKCNNLFDISLTVNNKKYTFEKTEIRVFKKILSDHNAESELVYKNYKGDHQNVFKCE